MVGMGLIGYARSRRSSMLMMLVAMELMVLGIVGTGIMVGVGMDDVVGMELGLFMLAVAGAETAVGLGVLVGYYRERKTTRIGWRE